MKILIFLIFSLNVLSIDFEPEDIFKIKNAGIEKAGGVIEALSIIKIN